MDIIKERHLWEEFSRTIPANTDSSEARKAFADELPEVRLQHEPITQRQAEQEKARYCELYPCRNGDGVCVDAGGHVCPFFGDSNGLAACVLDDYR